MSGVKKRPASAMRFLYGEKIVNSDGYRGSVIRLSDSKFLPETASLFRCDAAWILRGVADGRGDRLGPAPHRGAVAPFHHYAHDRFGTGRP